MNFETVIGIEVHAELKTNKKIYSPSLVTYGAVENSSTNVIDWGYPGVLPTLNRDVIDFALKAALALNCEITQHMSFDRKNYFYPDNPKAFQITQDRTPIGRNGFVEIELDGVVKRIGIERIHIEEDAGKSTHYNGYSLVDYNRQGVPLVEIVTDASMRSPEEAAAYVEALRAILLYTDVSDGRMEAGSMRADANISIRPIGAAAFGVKTEIKNINSISNMQRALELEVERHQKTLMSGGMIVQETRRYDDAARTTVLMRTKETASDYRYFPEPDLNPIYVDEAWIERIKATLPELPRARQQRYNDALGLSNYDSHVITINKATSNFFEATIQLGADPKQAANWLMGEIQGYLNKEQVELEATKLQPQHLADLLSAIGDGSISSKIAKSVFEQVISTGDSVKAAIESLGVAQISDESVLVPIINEVLNNNPQSIEDFKNGKDRAIGFLVGQIMKATKGQANPPLVNKLLLAEIKKR
ncbi:Asp-tRNA(Asn)/Glu-tRNA(Gln) amidotransferase subunit GatB [Culicoidibacter larvae]|uniref:Aspartyl/glutamyl-tRNA(Asn/Gln) amidotransferase subunit B n=1 Tax=Culicoidibacter larvae TaxID=2579976 RepID=A0A5R8QDP6_9FIRM|nr:Asp-tRNA(Asn)/Glu-tRNA(Gln) amidotransferase subunit GatB [Culicoidibacter larvae]TLG75351.1 Asp-tRNA(Asn)/Glu-tRNA(Gln) amidotransferase subunit GatB [Culicoidibacter larvae]